eukprot:scaffold803_cov310-Pinguiococcus_pyrenoidosus.AAC.186
MEVQRDPIGHASASVLRLDVWGGISPLACREEASTKFGFVLEGPATLRVDSGPLEQQSFQLQPEMYFSVPAACTIQGAGVMWQWLRKSTDAGRGFVAERLGYRGAFSLGGPIEKEGRLRYIDGCTDSVRSPAGSFSVQWCPKSSLSALRFAPASDTPREVWRCLLESLAFPRGDRPDAAHAPNRASWDGRKRIWSMHAAYKVRGGYALVRGLPASRPSPCGAGCTDRRLRLRQNTPSVRRHLLHPGR